MFDLVAMGESLIDFTPSGENDQGMMLFARNPGGAPANVLAMCARLGGSAAFIGKVGDDAFGSFLESVMRDAGIDVTGLCKTADVPTTLAFVHLNADGDRSFSFYRKPGADIALSIDEVPHSVLQQCRVFHFGSVSLTDEPVRSATLFAAREARAAGALISYDPNYRPALWKQEEAAVSVMRQAPALADIVKVSDEEMTLLTGHTDLHEGAKALRAFGATLVLVTGGDKGAYFSSAQWDGVCPAYQVAVADTTGAGDAFLGALLTRLCRKSKAEIEALSKDELVEIVRFGNAAGGLTATRYGAIPAMPTEAQIVQCTQQRPYKETDWA